MRPHVPERHFDFVPVDVASHRGGFQRFDIPPGATEDVAQRVLRHGGQWPLLSRLKFRDGFG